MDTPDIKAEVKFYSQSAFHRYMTNPVSAQESVKSAFNPYRKRAGIFSLLNLDAVEEALSESVDQIKNKSKHLLNTPTVGSGLDPLV